MIYIEKFNILSDIDTDLSVILGGKPKSLLSFNGNFQRQSEEYLKLGVSKKILPFWHQKKKYN